MVYRKNVSSFPVECKLQICKSDRYSVRDRHTKNILETKILYFKLTIFSSITET